MKQAWGTKRQCPNCGARFYDLNKDPIVCPKCQTVYEPEASKPPRRGRPAPVPKKPTPAETESLPDLHRLKAQMAAAHPDRGGSNAAFIAARARYVAARRQSRVQPRRT